MNSLGGPVINSLAPGSNQKVNNNLRLAMNLFLVNLTEVVNSPQIIDSLIYLCSMDRLKKVLRGLVVFFCM